MFKQTAIIGCVLALFGCSSVVQPVAQVSLVEKSSEQVVTVENSIQQILTSDASGASRVYAGETVQLSPLFFSARGAYCRTMSNGAGSRLFCKSDNGSWFEVPPVMSELNSEKKSETE